MKECKAKKGSAEQKKDYKADTKPWLMNKQFGYILFFTGRMLF